MVICARTRFIDWPASGIAKPVAFRNFESFLCPQTLEGHLDKRSTRWYFRIFSDWHTFCSVVPQLIADGSEANDDKSKAGSRKETQGGSGVALEYARAQYPRAHGGGRRD